MATEIGFRGRLTDGQNAASQIVTVRLGRALEITPDGTAEPTLWAFHRLESAVPISRNSKDVLLSSLDHPGQSLFVADPEFIRQLRSLAGQLSTTASRWRYAKPGLAVAGSVGAIAGIIYLFNLSPLKWTASVIPTSVRVALGEKALQSFTNYSAECVGEPGKAALDAMAARLTNSIEDLPAFNIRVVDDGMVNAFAVPGEHVVLMRGLIDEAKSADEVAGVLAHEMGHGIELHPETGILRTIGIAAAAELVLTGSSSTIGSMGSMLLQLRYTRDAEREADAHALRILKAAGVSSKPLADFFDRIDRIGLPDASGDDAGGTSTSGSESTTGDGSSGQTSDTSSDSGSVANIFSTHPPSPDRARLAREAATYPATPVLDEAQWQALRKICPSS